MNPAFIVGVTGHMDLREDEIPQLKRRFRLLLRFLKHGPHHVDPDAGNRQTTLLDSLVEQLPGPTDSHGNPYADALANWPGLPNTPIIVLTALAPGADSLVAEVVLGQDDDLDDPDEFKKLDIHVRAPLPFPHGLYRRASTFVRNDPPNDEDRQRQEVFDQLLEKIGPENSFPVMLESDYALTTVQQDDEFQRNVGDRAARNQRYYAAGEFNASYAHLLVAIWDHQHDNDTQAGTAAIVAARVRALRNPLPTTPGLTLTHGGPLLQLYTWRAKNNDKPSEPPSPMQLLHPWASAPKRVVEAAEKDKRFHPNQPIEWLNRLLELKYGNDAEWQSDRLLLFCRIAANLKRFNESAPAADAGIDRTMYERLGYEKRNAVGETESNNLEDELKTEPPEFYGGLRRIVALHRRASSMNYPLNRRTFNFVVLLFGLTFLAAVLLHLFNHWVPQFLHHGQAEHVENSDANTNETPPAAEAGSAAERHDAGDPADHDHHYVQWKPWIGTAALLLAAAALGWFWHFSSRQAAEQSQDYRALSEGLRVQFFWNLAGLGRSVSANYMQRQRNELDWIRAAIRTVSFPYHQWREWFSQLDNDQQIAALRCVRDNWVREQRTFFAERTEQWHHRLHACHRLGGMLAVSGLWVGVVLVVCAFNGDTADCFVAVLWWGWLVPVLLAAILLVVSRRQPTANEQHKPADQDTKPRTFKQWCSWFFDTGKPLEGRVFWCLGCCNHFLDRVAPATDLRKIRYTTLAQRRRTMAANFFGYLPISSVLAYLALLLCQLMAALSQTFPEPLHLSIACGGGLLLAGALLVAWSEKGLFSELSYQYNTMASLFRGAEVTLERDLTELESTLNNDPAQYQKKLAQIQDLFFDLGMEALDENAEWLILHRARPLEPVMAG